MGGALREREGLGGKGRFWSFGVFSFAENGPLDFRSGAERSRNGETISFFWVTSYSLFRSTLYLVTRLPGKKHIFSCADHRCRGNHKNYGVQVNPSDQGGGQLHRR